MTRPPAGTGPDTSHATTAGEILVLSNCEIDVHQYVSHFHVALQQGEGHRRSLIPYSIILCTFLSLLPLTIAASVARPQLEV